MKFAGWSCVICVVLWSCDKLDELTHFNIDYDTHVTIDSAVGLDLPFDVDTPDVETDSESEFEVNDTRKDLIEKIHLKSIRLHITAPEGRDFSFLKSVEIYISAEGLEEILIADAYDISDTVGEVLDLETQGTDLKEYIKKDRFRMRLSTVTDKALTQDVDVDVRSVFFVDAKILGL